MFKKIHHNPKEAGLEKSISTTTFKTKILHGKPRKPSKIMRFFDLGVIQNFLNWMLFENNITKKHQEQIDKKNTYLYLCKTND